MRYLVISNIANFKLLVKGNFSKNGRAQAERNESEQHQNRNKN